MLSTAATALASIPHGLGALALCLGLVLAVIALTVYIASGSIPRTIASGSWNATALNTGRWRVTFTPTNASTHTSFAGSFIAILANGLGAFWIVDRSLVLYNQSGAVITRPITWSAGQTITVVMDLRTSTGSITISGALTGNGTYTFTNTGTYFVAAETLGIGVYNGGGFDFTGSIGQVDDADDSLSFTADPAPSTGAGAAGALTPGVATLAGASGSSTAGANDPTAVSNGLVPDPAPSTGAGAGGTLVGGAVSIAGGTGTSTASASDPTLITAIQVDLDDAAPSTGTGGAGVLQPGVAAMAGAAASSSASASDPNLIVDVAPATSTGAAPGGVLTPGAVAIAGGSGSATAGAEDPTTPVALAPDAAPSTGAGSAGTLTPGAATIAGAAAASTAGAIDPSLSGAGTLSPEPAPSTGTGGAGSLSTTTPTLTATPDPAPSTGTGAVGVFIPGGAAMLGGVGSSAASALAPTIGSGAIVLPSLLTLTAIGTATRAPRRIGTAARSIRPL